MPEGQYYTPTVKKTSRRGGTGPRPHTWTSGPDLVKHEQHIAWSRHRAQAHFRGEGHTLTYFEWCEFWDKDNAWLHRGRRREALILTRIDDELPWDKDNCHIITRYEHLTEHNLRRRGTKYKKNKDVK